MLINEDEVAGVNGFDSGGDVEFDRSPKSFRKRLLRPSSGIKNLF